MRLFAEQFFLTAIGAFMADAIWHLALSDAMNPLDPIKFALTIAMGALMQRRIW